jgi:hypothetical protein
MAQIDVRTLPRETQILLGVAVLAFIGTFLPFDGIHLHGVGANEDAWHGVAGVLGSLAITLALAVAAGQVFAAASMPLLSVSWNFVLTAFAALATVLFVVHWIALPGEDLLGVHYGLSLQWGGYVEILLCIGLTVLAAMRLRETGETMPWAKGASAPPAT